MDTVDTLKLCIPVLKKLLVDDSKTDMKVDKNNLVIGVGCPSEDELLVVLEDKLQFTLKTMIKLVMTRPSKWVINIFKILYYMR